MSDRIPRPGLLPFLVVLVVLAACGQGADRDEELRIGTASLGGAYYPLAQGMSNLVAKYATGVTTIPVVTAGSRRNPRLLANGEIEIGMTNSDLAWFAFQGLSPYTEKLDIRAAGTLHPSILHLATLAGSGLEAFSDIRDKRVAVGPADGGTMFFVETLLSAHGMTLDDIIPSFLSYSDGFSQLGDGNVDAAFALAGFPAAAIMQTRATREIEFLGIDSSILSGLLQDNPYYETVEISPDIYDTTTPVTALAVSNMLIVRAAEDEELVYQVVSAVFDHLEELGASNANARQIDPGDSLMAPIPLHPGAARFFDSLSQP